MASTRRVTILLTDEEYEELSRMRGIAMMSAWIKERIFGGRDSDVQRVEPVRVARRGARASERPAPASDLGEPVYKSHAKACTCFLCNSARSAGLK